CGRQGLRRLRHLLLDRRRSGSVLLNVYFPAGQSRSQSRVLTFLSNREGKLIFIHLNRHTLLLRIEGQIFHLRRLQGLEHKFLRVRAPANDVHLFVVELAHDIFYPRPAHPHARSHWVDFCVCAPDRDLCPITRFPRDPADFDRAIGNFAHLQFEQTPHKIWMTPRDNDFRPTNSIVHRHHISAQSVTDIVIFHHHALALRHDRFEFSEIENYIRAIETAHRSANDFARAVLELFINHFLLDLANALHHRLLGRLRGDAPEIFWRHFYFHNVADFCVRLDSARRRFRNFVLRIRHLVRHDQIREGANLTGLRIDIDAEFARSAHAFLGSGEQCVRDGFEQNLALNPALALEIIQHCYKFRVHKKQTETSRQNRVGHQLPLQRRTV